MPEHLFKPLPVMFEREQRVSQSLCRISKAYAAFERMAQGIQHLDLFTKLYRSRSYQIALTPSSAPFQTYADQKD